MRRLQLVIVFLFVADLVVGPGELITALDVSLCDTIVLGYGYPCQEFAVTTQDGYVLKLQRIPYGLNSNQNTVDYRTPVILQHGLLQGGEVWLLNSPSESLAFILAEQGFDVWIANSRGSQASLGHISLSNHHAAYWNWSFHELGMYDIPAMLEFIYNTTGSKIHYVGHSQGTIIAFVGLTQPKVTNMLYSAVLLSPIAYANHITPKFVIQFAHTYIEKLLLGLGIGEFNPVQGIGAEIARAICGIPGIDCSDILTAVMGKNTYFNSTRFPYYLNFLPQSTSVKNMAHLAQLVRNGGFTYYDYGSPAENMKYYNQPAPPSYNLSSYPSQFPMLLASGGIDGLADVQDVEHLLSNLSCKVTHIFKEDYGHGDYLWGVDAYKSVYKDVVTYLKTHRFEPY